MSAIVIVVVLAAIGAGIAAAIGTGVLALVIIPIAILVVGWALLLGASRMKPETLRDGRRSRSSSGLAVRTTPIVSASACSCTSTSFAIAPER
jgi:hypothetical protein